MSDGQQKKHVLNRTQNINHHIARASCARSQEESFCPNTQRNTFAFYTTTILTKYDLIEIQRQHQRTKIQFWPISILPVYCSIKSRIFVDIFFKRIYSFSVNLGYFQYSCWQHCSRTCVCVCVCAVIHKQVSTHTLMHPSEPSLMERSYVRPVRPVRQISSRRPWQI